MYHVILVTTLGGFLNGYPLGLLGGVLSNKHFKHYFEYPTDQDIESLAGVLFAAAAVGCFAFGHFADAYGRRWCIFATGLLLTMGSVLHAAPLFFSTHLVVLSLGRALIGVAVGGLNSALSMYIGETAYVSLRGFLMSYFQMMFLVGIFAAYMINYIVLPEQLNGWKVSLGSQLPFSLLYLLVSWAIPESPRWLMLREDHEGARLELRKLRGEECDEDTFEEEMQVLTASCKPQPMVAWSQIPGAMSEWRSILAIALIVYSNACGGDMVTQFAPEILAEGKDGIRDESDVLLCMMLVGLISVVAALPPIFGIDWLGRRPFLIMGTTCCTLSMAFLSIGYALPFHHYTETVRSILHIAPLFLFNVSFALWGSCCFVVPSELLHTKVRSKVIAVGWTLAWVVDYACISSFLSMRAALGDALTFALYTAMNAAFGVFLVKYVPETLGCELDADSAELLAEVRMLTEAKTKSSASTGNPQEEA